MAKNILIISSSPRANSNSHALAESFAKGAESVGNTVDIVRLADKNIAFCKGCLACQKTQKCVIRDDAAEITEKMKNADVIVFASPVYYETISGQLKTMLDRANPLYTADYRFRDVYLLSAAAVDSESEVSGSVSAIKGWADCFERAELKGMVFGGGVSDPGDIRGHSAIEKAFEAGKNIC